MKLIVEAKTNKNTVMINTAKIRLPSGNIYTIDRDFTEYFIDTVNKHLCPKGILDLLTETDNEYAINWRNKCRENL